MSSGPLSMRSCVGVPRSATRPSMMATTSSAVQVRPDAHGQRFAGELVDDVAQLQPSAVGGLVELEVDGPHVVRVLGAQQLPTTGRPSPLALTRRWSAQSFFPPQTPRALLVDGVPLSSQQHVRGLPAPPRMPTSDRPQPATQLGFRIGDRPAWPTLRGAMLTGNPTRPTLGDPEAIDEHDHCSPAPLRGQKFPSASSLSIALSNSASANSFFNRAFSTSRSRSRFASVAFIPPYCARQRFQLDSDTSRWRSTSARSLPSFNKRSPSRSLRTTCSGVCRCRFIAVSSIPACWALDSHNRWTTIRGPGHEAMLAVG